MGSLHAQVAKLTIIGHFGILQVVLNLQEREIKRERERERERSVLFLLHFVPSPLFFPFKNLAFTMVHFRLLTCAS